MGFVYDGQGRVVLDPDLQIQEGVRLLFQTFARTCAVHATVKHFRTEGILFPTRIDGGPRKGEVGWGPLSLSRVSSVLHNPWYAGAYAFGRSRWRKQPDGRTRRESLPPGEWIALIRDAHPGYISWDEYLKNQQQLEMSARAMHFDRSKSPPREGPALLQGRAVCGLCGSRMHVRYQSRRGQSVPTYVCVGRGRGFADPMCQNIVGTSIDAAMSELLVEAVTPMALQMALDVQEEVQRRVDEADRLRHRQVERAQYEIDLARQRYMHVDPTNRLVADSLEADWNAKLDALNLAREEYERKRASDRLSIDDEQRRRILDLATDFPAAWRDPKTPDRERKRMLALLIEDVTLIKQRHLTAAVRFRGGATTTLTMPRPLTASQIRATNPEVRKQIDALLDEFTDAQVAHRLNELGLRTGAGEAFDPVSIRWVRFSAKLKSLKQRLLEAGMLTGRQMREKLGIGRTTLGRWRIEGRIKARICNDLGEWLYWPPEDPLATLSFDPTVRSTARGAL